MLEDLAGFFVLTTNPSLQLLHLESSSLRPL